MPAIDPQRRSRRGFVVAGLAVAAVWSAGAWRRRSNVRQFEFEPDPHVPGFRRLSGTRVSFGSVDPLVGMDDGRQEVQTPREETELCAWLFPDSNGTGVPTAYFLDYACPHCRATTEILVRVSDERAIDLSWQETPIFGPASVVAARAALAAGMQGAHGAFHRRLTRARFLPTDA